MSGLTLTDTFDSPKASEPLRSKTIASRAEPQAEAPLITDESAIYRRMDQRRKGPSWVAPATIALVLVAGGGALAFTLVGSHNLQQHKQAQLASNQATAPIAAPTATDAAPPAAAAQPAPAAQPTPAEQTAPAVADTSASSHHAAQRHEAAQSSQKTKRSAAQAEATAAIPPSPLPYAPSANNAAADVSATQPAPTPTAPPVNPAPTVTAPSQPAAPPVTAAPSPTITPPPAPSDAPQPGPNA